MTKPINDGGPAFPRSGQPGANGMTDAEEQDGMSLRDYFAGQAIQGFARELMSSDETQGWYIHKVAQRAYILADAMVEASQQPEANES